MAIFKPFKGYRPVTDKVAKIASRPYDVLNSEEAKAIVKNNPESFLRVVKPEVDLPDDIDLHSQEVYNKGKENLYQLIDNKIIKQDQNACYYIYAQTMNDRTQYGLVGCTGVEDYLNDIIKKHELTRPDKEEDRMNHIRVTDFNAEPVFFAYKDNRKIDDIVAKTIKNTPVYDFTTEDNIGHHFWLIENNKDVKEIEKTFQKEIDYVYVADGHHRTAAAALVGQERKKNNPNHTGNEEYNFFMAVLFPESQLSIIDYNRVVKDLNGLNTDEFIAKLAKSFEIKEMGKEIYKPTKLHEFSMYLEEKWYKLTAKDNTYDDNDPVGVLDVSILTNEILSPILNITDLRRSKRIDFVGGIRGLGELEKRVNSGEMKVAFALFPVSMQQLMDIADSGNIMPPKTTWFEPKLRSGLVTHKLS